MLIVLFVVVILDPNIKSNVFHAAKFGIAKTRNVGVYYVDTPDHAPCCNLKLFKFRFDFRFERSFCFSDVGDVHLNLDDVVSDGVAEKFVGDKNRLFKPGRGHETEQ